MANKKPPFHHRLLKHIAKIILLFFIICIPSLISCCHNVPRPQTLPDPSLQIMTFNVNWGMPAPEKVYQTMVDSKAQIICLQESNLNWELFLSPRLRELYPYIQFRHAGAAGGMAVFSKYPFEEISFQRPSMGWFGGWITHYQTPFGLIQVLNVHLKPPVGEQGVSVSAYLEAPTIHRQEIQELHPLLTPGIPTFIVGDFNEEDDDKAVAWLEKQSYKNSLSQFNTCTHTWEWPFWFTKLKGRYDHILHNQHFRLVYAEVLPVKASDHFPVIAIFFK